MRLLMLQKQLAVLSNGRFAFGKHEGYFRDPVECKKDLSGEYVGVQFIEYVTSLRVDPDERGRGWFVSVKTAIRNAYIKAFMVMSALRVTRSEEAEHSRDCPRRVGRHRRYMFLAVDLIREVQIKGELVLKASKSAPKKVQFEMVKCEVIAGEVWMQEECPCKKYRSYTWRAEMLAIKFKDFVGIEK